MSINEDGSLNCACTHLTPFGAFPPWYAPLESGFDDFESLWVAVVLCANVEVLTTGGIQNLIQMNWSRASAILISVMIAFCAGLITFAAGLDYQATQHLNTLQAVDVEVAPSPGISAQCSAGLSRLQERLMTFCKKNATWRLSMKDWIVLTVSASRLNLDVKSLKELQARAEDLESIVPQRPIGSKLSAAYLAISPKLGDAGLEAFITEMDRELSAGGCRRRLVQVLRASWATNPLREALCQSVQSTFTARAMHLICSWTVTVGMSALICARVQTIPSVTAPELCITQLDRQAIARSIAASITASIINGGSEKLFKGIEPKRRLDDTGRCCALTLKTVLYMMLSLGWSSFWFLYILAFLANSPEGWAWEWVLLGIIQALAQSILLIPFGKALLKIALIVFIQNVDEGNQKRFKTVVTEYRPSAAVTENNRVSGFVGILPGEGGTGAATVPSNKKIQLDSNEFIEIEEPIQSFSGDSAAKTATGDQKPFQKAPMEFIQLPGCVDN